MMTEQMRTMTYAEAIREAMAIAHGSVTTASS